MREIEYRAWLKGEREMVEVKTIHFGTRKIMYGYSAGSQNYGNASCGFDDCEIMQFTGLKDKNGVKIYEGDILARIYYDGTTLIEGVVRYGDFNCSCCNGVYGWYIDGGDIRDLVDSSYTPLFVIGNIYDNPELIKESESNGRGEEQHT